MAASSGSNGTCPTRKLSEATQPTSGRAAGPLRVVVVVKPQGMRRVVRTGGPGDVQERVVEPLLYVLGDIEGVCVELTERGRRPSSDGVGLTLTPPQGSDEIASDQANDVLVHLAWNRPRKSALDHVVEPLRRFLADTIRVHRSSSARVCLRRRKIRRTAVPGVHMKGVRCGRNLRGDGQAPHRWVTPNASWVRSRLSHNARTLSIPNEHWTVGS